MWKNISPVIPILSMPYTLDQVSRVALTPGTRPCRAAMRLSSPTTADNLSEGLHPDLHRPLRAHPEQDPDHKTQPLILVRWLGKDFDAQKILEIKQMEFGGKG